MDTANTLSPPQHIAIIMDGNGRWAKKRLMPRFMGHRKGMDNVRSIIKYCAQRHGIKALTLFAFSTENWKRPADEVTQLQNLFFEALTQQVDKLNRHNVRLTLIGDLHLFSNDIQQQALKAMRLTQNNDGLLLNIAVNYGGKADIVHAVNQWLIKNPGTPITEQALSEGLCLANQPAPDLLVRTGGEQRISNFLLWQLAYAELYFTDTLWPDFDENALDQAIQSFTQRERRFGQTSEQLNATT